MNGQSDVHSVLADHIRAFLAHQRALGKRFESEEDGVASAGSLPARPAGDDPGGDHARGVGGLCDCLVPAKPRGVNYPVEYPTSLLRLAGPPRGARPVAAAGPAPVLSATAAALHL